MRKFVTVHDSSGKLPSGLLNGNVNQFGDFDECISIDESNHDIRGKYCLAYIQIKAKENEFHSSKIFKIYEMLQSHFAFRSTLNDVSDNAFDLEFAKSSFRKFVLLSARSQST